MAFETNCVILEHTEAAFIYAEHTVAQDEPSRSDTKGGNDAGTEKSSAVMVPVAFPELNSFIVDNSGGDNVMLSHSADGKVDEAFVAVGAISPSPTRIMQYRPRSRTAATYTPLPDIPEWRLADEGFSIPAEYEQQQTCSTSLLAQQTLPAASSLLFETQPSLATTRRAALARVAPSLFSTPVTVSASEDMASDENYDVAFNPTAVPHWYEIMLNCFEFDPDFKWRRDSRMPIKCRLCSYQGALIRSSDSSTTGKHIRQHHPVLHKRLQLYRKKYDAYRSSMQDTLALPEMPPVSDELNDDAVEEEEEDEAEAAVDNKERKLLLWYKVLFSYFRFVSGTAHQMHQYDSSIRLRAKCRLCGVIISTRPRDTAYARQHLKMNHPGLFARLQRCRQRFEQCKLGTATTLPELPSISDGDEDDEECADLKPEKLQQHPWTRRQKRAANVIGSNRMQFGARVSTRTRFSAGAADYNNCSGKQKIITLTAPKMHATALSTVRVREFELFNLTPTSSQASSSSMPTHPDGSSASSNSRSSFVPPTDDDLSRQVESGSRGTPAPPPVAACAPASISEIDADLVQFVNSKPNIADAAHYKQHSNHAILFFYTDFGLQKQSLLANDNEMASLNNLFTPTSPHMWHAVKSVIARSLDDAMRLRRRQTPIACVCRVCSMPVVVRYGDAAAALGHLKRYHKRLAYCLERMRDVYRRHPRSAAFLVSRENLFRLLCFATKKSEDNTAADDDDDSVIGRKLTESQQARAGDFFALQLMPRSTNDDDDTLKQLLMESTHANGDGDAEQRGQRMRSRAADSAELQSKRVNDAGDDDEMDNNGRNSVEEIGMHAQKKQRTLENSGGTSSAALLTLPPNETAVERHHSSKKHRHHVRHSRLSVSGGDRLKQATAAIVCWQFSLLDDAASNTAGYAKQKTILMLTNAAAMPPPNNDAEQQQPQWSQNATQLQQYLHREAKLVGPIGASTRYEVATDGASVVARLLVAGFRVVSQSSTSEQVVWTLTGTV